VAVVLGVFLPEPIWTTTNAVNNLSLALAYMFGSACSALAGLFGMDVALKGNVRTTSAAKHGIYKAFPIAFRAGAVMGLSAVGLGVLGISIVYGIGVARGLDALTNLTIILGFSFGASALALFAKAGGGIYTKTADISADLVGKVELSIPEDDPRNPAVIADNVGDNVGDVAGMGADMIDSYIASLVAAMILGATLGLKYMHLPLVFAGLGIIASLLGVVSVRIGKKGDPGKALNRGTYITCVAFAVLALLAMTYLEYDLRIWLAAVVGLAAGIIIGITSDYFTSINRPAVKKTAESSNTGTAINIITGFSYGLESVVPPLFGIGITTAVAYFLCQSIGPSPELAVKYGVYGIGIAAFGMLSIVGSIVANDAYGPIGDNAKGIAEQSGETEEVVEALDKLDAAGNTTKAIAKGFAIGAAGLTVIALLAAYREIVESAGGTVDFSLMNPLVMLGVFIGLAMPPLFSALVMLGVGKNSSRMIKEIRRQFREIPGLKEGKEGVKPDYAACVDIATKGALKELMLPSILSIAVTLIVGFVCGIEALGGYLAGSIFSGLVFALLMANSGGLWDNAKKYIEAGALGGKGSDAHKAAVVGDTVGDPFKDTAGPSLNTQICVMALVANLIAPLLVLLWLA